jgi:hypothetical protein
MTAKIRNKIYVRYENHSKAHQHLQIKALRLFKNCWIRKISLYRGWHLIKLESSTRNILLDPSVQYWRGAGYSFRSDTSSSSSSSSSLSSGGLTAFSFGCHHCWLTLICSMMPSCFESVWRHETDECERWVRENNDASVP